MEMHITVEDIIQIIRNKRNYNEAWMAECSARSQWNEYSGHIQRRDVCAELLQDIQDLNLLKVNYPKYTPPEVTMEKALAAAAKIANNRQTAGTA